MTVTGSTLRPRSPNEKGLIAESLFKKVWPLIEKGVEVITTEEGGTFRRAETETIDYVAQANTLFEQQKPQRDQIRDDINSQQDNIDRYRAQAQTTIDDANVEINKLRKLKNLLIKTQPKH